MAFIDKDHVISCDGVVLWDGITKPGEGAGGGVEHSIKIGIPANAAEHQELIQLANNTLAASEFKGVMPPNGSWPVMAADVAKYTAALTGHITFSAKTRNGAPPVFDANGQELQPMQYGRSLFPGAVVKVLVHCYAFNNKMKGVAFGLDGISIVNDKVPALPISGGMSASDVGNAFKGGTAAAGGAIGGKVMAPGCQFTYAQLQGQGWTDAQMIASGYLLAPVAALPVPPTPVAPPTPPAPVPPPVAAPTPPPPVPVVPAHDLVPGGKVMAPGCQFTYAQLQGQGWTDAQMIASGYLLA